MRNKTANILTGSIIFIIIILTIIRSTGHYHFRPDAAKNAMTSFNGTNIIRSQSLQNLENPLLIRLDNSLQTAYDTPQIANITISPDLIADRKNMRIISSHRGARVLLSNNPDISSRVWMVLSQAGIKDLYILAQ